MGVISSTLIRMKQRINVENRAFRAIERKNPVSAPRHPTASKYLDDVISATPEVRKELDTKDTKLDKYLKDVYVTSTGSMPEIVRDVSLLPKKREMVTEDEFGFWQPDEVPPGKASLGQILQFMSEYQTSHHSYNAQIIAKEYKLDEKLVANVLEFYRPLNMFVPKKDPLDKKGMYSVSRLKRSLDNLKQIGDSKKKGEEK